jgi:C-terminal processing protease CtpA/Prc
MKPATDRDLIGVVYRALVRDSLVPSDATIVGRAAATAITRRGRELALPPDFGVDVDRDAAFLVRALPPDGPWWDVLTAMAWETGVAHTAVTDEAFAVGMMARLRGEPLTAPGFFLWRQGDGRLAVADLDPAGSGHASGLRNGDVVLDVDGRPAGRANSEVLPFYTAPAGASFDLTIERDGARLPVRLELAPADVPCVTERRLEDDVGHLTIRWFATSDDARGDVGALARRAVASLVADGAPGIVIDVRSGLGGQLTAANDVISLLCDAAVVGAHRAGDGVVKTGRRTGPRAWVDACVAVLVNEQTISAAEYLALGLEELAGATIVGTPTAGGLHGIRFVDLADGHRLALPSEATIGPTSGVARPGFRLQPHVRAPNPTVRELAAGIDPALEAARRVVVACGASGA